MLTRILLLFVCILLYLPGYSIQLKGNIIDENKMPLSFASILVNKTTIGTTANNSGEYVLDLDPGIYTITCKTIGYQSLSKTITITNATQTLDFQLIPQKLNLQEVTISIKNEDPAYPIMRKVIAKRKYHADLIQTLESDIYLKGALRTRSFPDKILGFSMNSEDMKETKQEMGIDSNGKGVLYLLEEISHYYYKAPDKMFHEILSVRQSGDPKGLGFATMPPIINIYENNLRILDGINERGFISPANSNAFQYYKYKFLGTYLEDDRVINKIKITPKRKYEPLFSGYLYVVDDEWVFHSVDLLLTKESQISTIDTLKFEQNYRPLAKDIWVIQSQVIYPTLSIFGIDISGNFVTSYSKQKLNQEISEDKLNSKIISVYDSTAMDKELAYWDSIRPIPLEKDEIKDFKFKDSLYVENKEKEDSISKKTILRTDFFLSGFQYMKGKSNLTMRPLISSVAFNSAEGLNATIALNYTYKFNPYNKIEAELFNRYGFANERYQILGKLGMFISDTTWKGRNWHWQITGGRYVYQINPDNPITSTMNELYTLLGGRNYLKIYENKLAKVELGKSWGNGLSAKVTASYEQRNPLFNTSDYTFSEKHDDRLTPNQPLGQPQLRAEDAAIASVRISYQPGWKYIQYPKYKYPVKGSAPVFSVNYTKGIPNIINSLSDFDKWSVDMQHAFRLKLLGNLEYRLEAGGFFNTNKINLPDFKHITGNQTFLANPYLNSFQLAPYYRFSNTSDIYFQGHAEWHLGGLFTNKIPLFKRLNWFLLGGSNALYVNEKDYYAEVFVGLENIGIKIFRFGRIDFVAGYESGVSKPRLGIRLSFGQLLESLVGIQKNKEL